MRILAFLPLLLMLPNAFAQYKVDLRNTYTRLLCIVPMTGAGTPADPRRPEFAPVPGRTTGAVRSGIVAFTFLPSDDGKSALVEFVARDQAAFRPLMDAKRSDIRIFQKGKAKRADIEAEFRKLRKIFDLDNFGVTLQ